MLAAAPFRILAARAGRWLVLAVLAAASPAGAQEFPAHIGKVNDFAAVLSAAQRDRLETDLAALERDTSAEMAVVTVTSLDGRPLEEYATALFNEWGIGKRDRDNGVLVLVAPSERAMKIEVGYGLEPVLPDGLAGAIIRETFLPRFRDERMADGIVEGSARLIALVRRNEVVTPEQRAAYDAAANEAGKSWGMAAFFSIFVGVGAFIMGSGAGAKVIVQTLFGAVFMVGPLFAAYITTPRTALVLLVLFGVVVAWLGVRIGRRPAWRSEIRGTGKSQHSRGWTVGSTGGSTSGGSSSSGGFSGGRSGGGGASGRW